VEGFVGWVVWLWGGNGRFHPGRNEYSAKTFAAWDVAEKLGDF
jgi:hypothetical protein